MNEMHMVKDGHRVPDDWQTNDTQQKLDDLLEWDKVYAWAKQYQPKHDDDEIDDEQGNVIGMSSSQLFCPLANYLNEKWPVEDHWEIGGFADILKTEWDNGKSYTDHYSLPDWATDAMTKVDEIGGEEKKQIWITQEKFLHILEDVRP